MKKINFEGRSILSIDDLDKDEIVHILETARKLELKPRPSLLKGKIMAAMFFEPSTRTRLSFESSMKRLGGEVITVADSVNSSRSKGETVYDTAKMVEQYADIIVMRHPYAGSARVAAEATKIPVINGGDGANQHPTQTLLDLYTIKKTQGKISGLNVAMVGDLKYGRTVHSLASALSHFDCNLFFVAPPSLRMPSYIRDKLDETGTKFKEYERIGDVLDKVDILYVTRIQKERFPDAGEYEKVKNIYCLKKNNLGNVKDSMKIMHPLPRVNEINRDVDDTVNCAYFEQAGNGIPVRQALLGLLMGAIK